MKKHTNKKLFFEFFLPKACLGWWFGMIIYQGFTFIKDFTTATTWNSLLSLTGCMAAMYLTHHFYNKYKPNQKWQLRALVQKNIKRYGPNCDLNHINVSRMTDMSALFHESDFDGDISKWDTSNVTDMSSMFFKCNFNGDISKWDVSKVTNMSFMFAEAQFNGDLSKWNVSNVTDMTFMFNGSQFNGDISQWNVAKVKSMEYMFYNCPFSGDIVNWDVSNVENISAMFSNSKFKNILFDDPSINQDDLLPLPYWAEFEDSISRKNAITNYFLHKNLVVELKENEDEHKVKKPKL